MAIVLAWDWSASSCWKAKRRREPRPAPSASVATIASRVEVLRGLKFRTQAGPADRFPCTGATRGPRGPRSLLPRDPPPRRRGGPQAARADRARRRPARDLGLGVRRGRRGLLRPALEAAADRLRDDTRRAQRNGSCTRADPRARGSALRAGRQRGGERRRRARPARARRGHGDARHAGVPRCATSGPRRRSAGCSGPPSRPVPTCPKFLQDQLIWPVPRRRAVHPGAAPDGRRDVEAGRPRRPRARARTAPSRSCTRRSGWRWRSRCPCASTSRCTTTGTSVASGTWGEWQTRELLGGRRRGRRRVGRGPLRALAAGASAPRRRAATPTC